MPELSDDAAVDLFRETGDGKYFEILWRKYAHTVHRRCLAFLRNKTLAEDIASATFLHAFVSVRSHYTTGNFEAWLLTVARNKCINYVKRASPTLAYDEATMAGPEARTHVVAEIEGILNQLSPEQRIALKLHYISGCSYQTIAEHTQASENDVKSWIQNGKRMFKQLWLGRKQGTTV